MDRLLGTALKSVQKPVGTNVIRGLVASAEFRTQRAPSVPWSLKLPVGASGESPEDKQPCRERGSHCRHAMHRQRQRRRQQPLCSIASWIPDHSAPAHPSPLSSATPNLTETEKEELCKCSSQLRAVCNPSLVSAGRVVDGLCFEVEPRTGCDQSCRVKAASVRLECTHCCAAEQDQEYPDAAPRPLKGRVCQAFGAD
eukprot:4842925-Amphidinium_carterae.2